MSPKNRVTITDVAEAAGVSPGTVSRVLNNRTGVKISDETQEQVRRAVKKLGYHPNLFASALRTQRTGVIGAIVRDINDPFLSLMARELQKAAHTEGLELLLGHAEYDPEIASRQLNVMRNWFDGLLIIGDMLGYQAAISKLDQDDIPSVALANGQNQPGSKPLISIDDAHGTQLGVDYLFRLGHRRIAFMGNTNYAGIRQRWNAFKQCVEEKSLFWTEEYFQLCQNNRQAAVDSIGKLLNLSDPPTAVFCMTDLMAFGAISGAWQMGWRIPETISILGFDDIEEATTAYPALSTIRQPVKQMASQALDLLLKLIDGAPTESAQLPSIVQPELIIRRSCAPPVG
jgi:LacI family transcriptional regulator, repressor for deo operon, udp, cdd, tsx, nupC, and nupG